MICRGFSWSMLAFVFLSAGHAWADPAPLFEDTYTSLDPAFAGINGLSVNDGKLAIALSANSSIHVLYQVAYFADADISATLSCAANDPSGASEGGIVFWGVDSTDYYDAVVAGDGSCLIYNISHGTTGLVVSVPPSPAVKTGTGAANLVRVVTTGGNSAVLYVNGTKVMTLLATGPAGGGTVGIYTQTSPTTPATWTVQDFKVLSVSQ